MSDNNKFFDRFAPDQMVLDNPLQHLRGARMIPDTLRVNDRNGPLLAYLQTISFGTEDAARPDQFQLFQPFF